MIRPGPPRLLELELSTLYVLDADGRLVRERRASGSAFFPPPLVAVAAGAGGLVRAYGSALPSAVVAEVDAALRREADAWPEGLPLVGWAPRDGDAVLRLLAPLAHGVLRADAGPSYVAPVGFGAEPDRNGVELRTSEDTELAELRPRLPERDAVLDPPWVAALVDGEVAAVCETARSAPSSVEAGVWTYEAHRRRGLATLVTAAWLGLVGDDRTAFYSTSAGNVASQGVARRLGLTPIGQWWQVRATATAE